MKKYVQQLLADIRNAAIEHKPFDFSERNEPGMMFDENDNDFLAAHFRQVEDYVSGQGGKPPLVQLLGLTEAAFPPVEKLDQGEMQTITNAVIETLFTHGITLALPETAPPGFNYQLLLNQFGRETMVPTPGSGSFIGIDFCTGNSEGCELKEYCSCLQFAGEQSEMDIFSSNNWAEHRPSKKADKVFKAMLKAARERGKHSKFDILIKARGERLSKEAKPIYKWLKLDMDIFGEYRTWQFRDVNLVLQSVQMAFPKMDWSWVAFTAVSDIFDMTIALLEVRADFDKKGWFYTTREELFWFLQLGERMAYKHKQERDGEELPF